MPSGILQRPFCPNILALGTAFYYENELADVSLPQAARTRAIQAAYRQATSASERDNAPSASNIRGLGTLGGDDDTKAVAGAS